MYMRHSAWPHHWTFQHSNPSSPSSCPASCASCARFVPGGALAELPSGMERHDLRAPFFPAAMEENLVAMWHDRDSHCCPCSATKLKGVNQLLQPQLIVVFALVVAGFWILMTLHIISLWIL